MPGIERLSVDLLLQQARTMQQLGIPAIALFPVVSGERKSPRAEEAYNGDGLVQRAVRTHGDVLPESIRIGVQKVDGEIVIVTRIAQVGGCAEDFELARVRERLAGLYGDRASLHCVELEPQTTQFTLRVTAER